VNLDYCDCFDDDRGRNPDAALKDEAEVVDIVVEISSTEMKKKKRRVKDEREVFL